MAQFYLQCRDCGHATEEERYQISCGNCGDGFLDVVLDNPLRERCIDDEQSSIFKFHKLMPFQIEPRFLDYESFEPTPEFTDVAISDAVDAEIVVKDEMCMPTGTWKDREGFMSLYRMAQNGLQDVVVFSSGNTGISLARSATLFQQPRLHMIAPRTSQRRIEASLSRVVSAFVQVQFFDGSNDECIAESATLAKRHGYALEGGFANYARREGLKLLALEHILISKSPIDWYAQPVAGGIGIYSLEKAYRDCGLDAPRILGVQAEICAPMVEAWRDNSPVLENRHIPQEVVPSDFVRVLRTRDPGDAYRIVKGVLDRCEGAFEAVSDAEILAALRTYYRSEYFRRRYREDGVLVGLEPATALAGIRKAVDAGVIRKGSKVLLNVSGAAKEGDVRKQWLEDLG